MSRPRFESIRLEYGCHSGRFELPSEDRPVVIAGRNGTGKTTLLEAFLRGLYGFVRRKPEERNILQLREPWSGRPPEVEVQVLTSEGERIAIHRSIETDEVIVREIGANREIFHGDANPVGSRSASRHYQDLLREWIGFASLEPYRETAWIAQGELVDTHLNEELLRVAAGTHRKVETALTELRDAYEELTLEPIEPGGRKKARPRVVEELRDAEADATRRLEAARRAKERKRPVLQRATEVRAEIASLDADIALLEAAYRPITERRTLLAEQREAEARLSALSGASEDVRMAATELARLEAEGTRVRTAGHYPEDFEARLGRAEELWNRLSALKEGALAPGAADPGAAGRRGGRAPAPGLAAAGALVVAVGLVLSWSASALLGGVLGILGVALLVSAWVSRRTEVSGARRAQEDARRVREEIATIRSRLAEVCEGVPDPPLSSSSVSEHRRAFRQQSELEVALRAAKRRLGEATESARRLLRHDGPEEAADVRIEPADVERRLREAREAARVGLARLQLRLEEQPAAPRLPDGVEATVPAIESARDDRRTRREELRQGLSSLELEILDLDRASEDAFQLERELSDARDRRAEAEAEAEVRRGAWELVRDAYEQFRATDQERLLTAINGRLDALSRGRLGPVEVEAELSEARVKLENRIVALDSPPLSFGEKHVVLLAIRLGAADFVAGSGVRHPLLVDEPFAHLDEIRAREVWDVLSRLASERQVIVTSQDRLMLDHLRIRPDIDLAAPRQGRSPAEASRPARSASPQDDSPAGDAATDPARKTPASTQAQLELG